MTPFSNRMKYVHITQESYYFLFLFFLGINIKYSQENSSADVIKVSVIFEGSIVRSARRLDEFLNQVTFLISWHAF